MLKKAAHTDARKGTRATGHPDRSIAAYASRVKLGIPIGKRVASAHCRNVPAQDRTQAVTNSLCQHLAFIGLSLMDPFRC